MAEQQTAGEILVETLIDWGVDTIFGLPGDGINGIMEALRTRQDRVRFVHVRHEESAAFMAVAYAKYTGRLGVCIATSGPGGLHLLNGLYDAKLDGQSVLAITGLPYHDLIGTFTQQDVELDKVFADVAVYNQRIMGPAHVENVTDLACRSALKYHGVAHIAFPVDFQEMPVEKRSKRNVQGHTSDVMTHSVRVPEDGDLRRAAEVLNAGQRVVILAGQGALGAGEQLERCADLLGAPIVKALLGKGCVPDDSPYAVGGLGLLGTKPAQEALEGCDTLLIVGSSFPYLEFYPKPGQASCVQIDRDPARIGLRYGTDAGLVGDAAATLDRLAGLLHQKADRAFLEQAQHAMDEWWGLMEEQGTRQELPMKPQVPAWELGQRLDDSAIVSSDSGAVTVWFARQLQVKRGQLHSASGTLASMGNGLPYALAAQIAYPDRQCVAVVGDGGFSMLMAEFATAVQYQLPIKVFVFKNNTLGMIKWEQMLLLGNPEFGCAVSPIDFAAFARACGGTGFTITDPATCGDQIQQALNTPGPVLVECVVDENEPLLPPKVTPEDAKHLAEALSRGTPNPGGSLSQIIGARIREMV